MTLSILSYNILAGGEDRLTLITDVIQMHHSDVVALLEARNLPNAESLSKKLGMSLAVGEANNVNRDHVVWLSRLPVSHTQNHSLPVFSKTLLEIEIIYEGTPVTLFATHLKAGDDREREHLRVAEMQTILTILHSCKNHFHALVGDLNTVHPADNPDVPTYIAALKEKDGNVPDIQFPREVIPFLLEAGYVDCYRKLHPRKPGYTYTTSYQALRIDYVFASPAFAQHLHACDIMTTGNAKKASDHFPIWAEFK